MAKEQFYRAVQVGYGSSEGRPVFQVFTTCWKNGEPYLVPYAGIQNDPVPLEKCLRRVACCNAMDHRGEELDTGSPIRYTSGN